MDLFHVLNRGVDKRTIFTNERDYYRFIHNLFEFNDVNSTLNSSRLFNKMSDIERRSFRKERERLVDIHAFSLMPNHYHLLLSARRKDAIPNFMKKINMGYAKYFNLKYERSGTLFEGRYKSIRIMEESHFIHLPYYIHLNPLDLIAPEWRRRTMMNPQKALDYLQTYRWSSYLDYIGTKNFPSVISRGFLSGVLGKADQFKKHIKEWLEEMPIEQIESVMLESTE